MFCIFWSIWGDPSLNGWWVIALTSKSWHTHRYTNTHTDAGDDKTRRPKGLWYKNNSEYDYRISLNVQEMVGLLGFDLLTTLSHSANYSHGVEYATWARNGHLPPKALTRCANMEYSTVSIQEHNGPDDDDTVWQYLSPTAPPFEHVFSANKIFRNGRCFFWIYNNHTERCHDVNVAITGGLS